MPPVPSTPCSGEAVPPRIYEVLSKALDVYAEGMKAELRDHGFSTQLADDLENINIDIKLHAAQLESREQLERQTRKHATRRGILERACIEFSRRIEPLITSRFSTIDEELPSRDWYDALRRETRNMLREVIDHTRNRLSDPPKDVACTMEHHGVLYALLAREAIRRCGKEGEKALVDGTVKHAVERGTRMRQHAVSNGDTLERNNYRLYREWPDQGPGKMVPGPTQYSPSYITSITRCEWVEVWKKHGLSEYALYFCEHMDKNLYQAFHEDFVVEVPTLIPRGDAMCTFDWGFEMTESMREEFDRKRTAFGDKFTRDFTFHTGHVLRTVGETLVAQLGDKGQDAYDAATFEFIKRFGSDYLIAAEKAFPVL
jgi:Arc/MetJ family transcription regulator